MEKKNKKTKKKKKVSNKRRRIKVISERVLTDCYEFLHLVEVGRGSLQDLMQVFGNENNLEESNYRQVERIKHRCNLLGVEVYFDPDLERFVTEKNAKLKLLSITKNIRRPRKGSRPKPNRFGNFIFRKVVDG